MFWWLWNVPSVLAVMETCENFTSLSRLRQRLGVSCGYGREYGRESLGLLSMEVLVPSPGSVLRKVGRVPRYTGLRRGYECITLFHTLLENKVPRNGSGVVSGHSRVGQMKR